MTELSIRDVQVAADRGNGSSGSIRETREFVMHPDEIKELRVGEAVYVNKQRGYSINLKVLRN